MSSHDVDGEQVEIRWRKPEQESVALELPKTAIGVVSEAPCTLPPIALPHYSFSPDRQIKVNKG